MAPLWSIPAVHLRENGVHREVFTIFSPGVLRKAEGGTDPRIEPALHR